MNQWHSDRIIVKTNGVGKDFKRNTGDKPGFHPILRWIAVILICFHLLVALTPIEAKTCIPYVKGKPGGFGQMEHPDWYSPNQVFPDSYSPNDLRWAGSMSHAFGYGSTSHAEFHSLYNVENNVKVLYLSFEVKVAPSSPKGDALYLGFYNPVQGNGTIIKIKLAANSTEQGGVMIPRSQTEGGKVFFTPSVVQGTGTSAWNSVSVPGWLTQYARVWMSNSKSNTWAVAMRIPIDANSIEKGLPISNTDSFRMWVYFQVGGPEGNASSVIPYTLPRTGEANPIQYVYREVNNTPMYPDPAQWEEAGLFDPEFDSDCQSGILIDSHLIGTTNTPISKMNLFSSNSFFARPLNYSKSPVPASSIKAAFKIANWGSSVADISTESWKAVPGGEDVAAVAQIPGQSNSSPGVGYMFFQWTLTPEQRCGFVGKNGISYPDADPPIPGDVACSNAFPVQMLHQCIGVKLTGVGLNFLRDSAFRNMDFTNLPRVVQTAEISVAGLSPVSSVGSREVYLLLETRNMPGNISFKRKAPVVNLTVNATQTMNISQPSAGQVTIGQSDSSFDFTAEVQPTYVVHAYHDTGTSVTFGGKRRVIFLPQTSFGYFLTYNDELEGWKSSLSGRGLRRVGSGLYRVTVVNNRSAVVTTEIRAVAFRRFAMSARVGIDFPAGALNTNYNSGLSFNVGAEYMLKKYLSVELGFGFHRFANFGILSLVPMNMYQFTIGGRYYFYNVFQRFKPFLNVAIGFYRSSEPRETNFGVNLGGGMDYYLSNVFALEIAYNYHTLSVGDPNTKFSTLQAGLRYRF